MNTERENNPLDPSPSLWQRIVQHWSAFRKKNFVTWRLNWFEPRAVRRVINRLEAQHTPSTRLQEFFLFFLLGVAVSVGGILSRWLTAKPIMNDWALFVFLPPAVGIFFPLLIHGIIWLSPRTIAITNLDIRREEGQIFRMWKWIDMERAEIARALFCGEEARVLQLYLRQPPASGNPVQIGIAAKITDDELLRIFEEYQVPLILTDEPPAGMERWQS